MFQSDIVIAIVMLFVLLPAARLIRRFVYAIFDMFDRGNPVDEAGQSMMSTMNTLMGLARTAGIGKMVFGRGGGGGGPSAPSNISGRGSSPDRLGGISNEQNINPHGEGRLGIGASGPSVKGESTIGDSITGAIGKDIQNEGAIQQYGHLPENRHLPTPEWQNQSLMERGLEAGRLLATGTDHQPNIIPFRSGEFRNSAVPVAERGRPTIQAMGGIQRGVQSARISSSAGIGAGSRTASYRGTGYSRVSSAPPNIVPIKSAGTPRVTGNLNRSNIAQVTPNVTRLDSQIARNITSVRPSPVRIQPAGGNQISRPSIQPVTPYAVGGQNSFRPQAGTVVQRPSNFTNSSPGPDSSIGQSRLTSSDTSQHNRQDIHIQQAMNTPIVRQEPPKIRNYTERNEG